MTIAKTSAYVLSKSGGTSDPGLVPDVSRNAPALFPFNTMVTTGLSSVAFIMLKCVLSVLSFFRVLKVKRY